MIGWLTGNAEPSDLPPSTGNKGGGKPTSSSYPSQPAPAMMPQVNANLDFDAEPETYVPMDGDMGIYEATYDLDVRLADREFEKKDQTDYVTMEDVQSEMETLKADKEQDDSANHAHKKRLQDLVAQTIKFKDTAEREKLTLTAVRICQIENRLKNDTSLWNDGKAPDGVPDAPQAATIKKALKGMLGTIKRERVGLSSIEHTKLDERIKAFSELQ